MGGPGREGREESPLAEMRSIVAGPREERPPGELAVETGDSFSVFPCESVAQNGLRRFGVSEGQVRPDLVHAVGTILRAIGEERDPKSVAHGQEEGVGGQGEVQPFQSARRGRLIGGWIVRDFRLEPRRGGFGPPDGRSGGERQQARVGELVGNRGLQERVLQVGVEDDVARRVLARTGNGVAILDRIAPLGRAEVHEIDVVTVGARSGRGSGPPQLAAQHGGRLLERDGDLIDPVRNAVEIVVRRPNRIGRGRIGGVVNRVPAVPSLKGFITGERGANCQEPERLTGLDGQVLRVPAQVEEERGSARNRNLPFPEKVPEGFPERIRPVGGSVSRHGFLIQVGGAQVLDRR